LFVCFFFFQRQGDELFRHSSFPSNNQQKNATKARGKRRKGKENFADLSLVSRQDSGVVLERQKGLVRLIQFCGRTFFFFFQFFFFFLFFFSSFCEKGKNPPSDLQTLKLREGKRTLIFFSQKSVCGENGR